ncbi:MAG TPA: hypothetical protein PKK26_12515 [Candidatus Wallbacteria bacterium]|nr:hypothetical protein [Candidatus Wallbacteria bacterium]
MKLKSFLSILIVLAIMAPMALFAAEKPAVVDAKMLKQMETSTAVKDKLFILEYKHWLFAAQRPEVKKEDVLKNFQSYNEYSSKFSQDMINDISQNEADAQAKVQKLLIYIKAKKSPAVFAFQPFVKNLADALKNQALDTSKKGASEFQESYARTAALLKWINAQPAPKNAIMNSIDLQDVSKHYDPTHPGHLHESPNGGLYHQPGDNGPFSGGGSYNHGGHHQNHPSYPSYPTPTYPSYPPAPTYPTYPPNYYPPQYPNYPTPDYYPSNNGQVEHIHHCARCRRQFSYYPNGYAPTCPYCGYYGY